MWRLKPPKVTHFAELTIGTAIRPSRGRLRTVGNGCATSSEHTVNPQTPRVKREPLLRIREKTMCTIHTQIYIYIYMCHVQNILYWRWSSIPSWESHHTGYIDPHSWIDNHSPVWVNNPSFDPGTYGVISLFFPQPTRGMFLWFLVEPCLIRS